MKSSTSTLMKRINLGGRSVKKIRDGFIVRTLFVSVCVCWFLSSEVLAGDGGIAGTYVRVDGAYRLVINSDQTYQLGRHDGELVDSGLYEEGECSHKIDREEKGNVVFYTADGNSCCVSLRKLGSKTLMRHIAGYSIEVCSGGVYERQ